MTQQITATSTVDLDAEQIAGLFEREFEGFCPACKYSLIDEGEPLCCDCFKAALAYHINTCGCYP